LDKGIGKLQRNLIIFLSGAIFALIWMERWRRSGNYGAAEEQIPTPPQTPKQEEPTGVGMVQQIGRRFTGPIVAGMKADLGHIRRAASGAGKQDVNAQGSDVSRPNGVSVDSISTKPPTT
jgi:hypothetical protein